MAKTSSFVTPRAEFDNQIRMQSPLSPDNTSEVFLFGADRVLVGQENKNEQEIVTDDSGYKRARNKVEEVEIYNLHKQAHHCWLMIDLETGGRGWYPGSKEVVLVEDATIFTAPDDSSTIIAMVQDMQLDKQDMVYGIASGVSKKIIYVKVTYNGQSGYIKNSKVVDTKFIDRS